MMISLKDRRIILIGGAGFIGHHLALALKKAQANVHIIDSLQVNNLLDFTSTTDTIANRNLYLQIIHQRLDLLRELDVPLYVQDARDYHALSKLINQIQPQVIIQLAAVAHAGRSNKDPYSTFDHSLRTLENALDATYPTIEQFVYFSSSMVYGSFQGDQVTEESPCNPLGIYGALKFSGEKIVIAYNQVFGLPYTIIRPSALYGERCVSRRVGQIFIENALQGKDISVSGNGSDRLDFTYIKDLVQGVLKILTHENAKNQIFNLTFGQSRSIEEMINILRRHIPELKVKYLPKDKLIPDRGTLAVDKVKSMITYNPEYPLEKGFEEYIKWYKKLYNGNHK